MLIIKTEHNSVTANGALSIVKSTVQVVEGCEFIANIQPVWEDQELKSYHLQFHLYQNKNSILLGEMYIRSSVNDHDTIKEFFNEVSNLTDTLMYYHRLPDIFNAQFTHKWKECILNIRITGDHGEETIHLDGYHI